MAASLKSMAADANNPGVKKTDLYRVDPRLLQEQPDFNLRDYDDPDVIAHIEGFANSYAQGLYVPPLVVRTDETGRVLVIEGHCRRHGALLAIERGADLAFVDCIPFRGNDVERTEIMLRSAEGLKLKPLNIALGYLRLIRMGHTKAMVAERMNKTTAHVEQMLVLANANSDVHRLVRDGKVAPYAAIEAVRQHGERAGAFLAAKVEAMGGDKPVTRSVIKEWVPPRKFVTSMHGALSSVVSSLDKTTRRQLAEFEKLHPEELQGKKVEVDAATFLELVKVHGAVADAKAAKEAAQESKKQQASQQSIPGADDAQQGAVAD